jgi:tocopherol O-methyltransferase
MQKFSYLQIFKMSGWHGLLFIKPVKMMEEAFAENRVKYGVFIAHKI